MYLISIFKYPKIKSTKNSPIGVSTCPWLVQSSLCNYFSEILALDCCLILPLKLEAQFMTFQCPLPIIYLQIGGIMIDRAACPWYRSLLHWCPLACRARLLSFCPLISPIPTPFQITSSQRQMDGICRPRSTRFSLIKCRVVGWTKVSSLRITVANVANRSFITFTCTSFSGSFFFGHIHHSRFFFLNYYFFL